MRSPYYLSLTLSVLPYGERMCVFCFRAMVFEQNKNIPLLPFPSADIFSLCTPEVSLFDGRRG